MRIDAARAARVRGALVLALALALPFTLPAGRAHANGNSPPTGSPLTDYQRAYGTWAYADVSGVPIRALPQTTARRIARLRALTEDGRPEVYEIVGQTVDARGVRWVHLMVPMRPNGQTGWVPAGDLGGFHLVRSLLVINRPTRELTLFRSGRVVFRTRVGVGKPSTPTPAGHFWIREKFPVSGVPLYGPYAIGTSNYSAVETDWPGGGVVGIHGTDQPGLIPGAPSHGCIRLRNADITRLYRLVTVGTPLIII